MTRFLAFFGAFNPPTLAHLDLAEHARQITEKEGVIFVPSKSAYIRDEQGKDYAYDEETRLQMLRAASETRPWMRVTDWEMRLSHQPRTWETLCHLREEGLTATLLMGSDKLIELETGWLHVPEIAREFGIVCIPRAEDEPERLLKENSFLWKIAPWVQVIPAPEKTRQVSSTGVRRLVREIQERERALAELVPEEIVPMLR